MNAEVLKLFDQLEAGASSDGALADIVKSLKAALSTKKEATSFSQLTPAKLSNMAEPGDRLNLKADHWIRATAAASLGDENLWCSDIFHHHLTLLEGLVPHTNEASARSIIDAFFFRVSAMVEPKDYMVLSLEQGVPQTITSSKTTLGGVLDYVALVAQKGHLNLFYHDPRFDYLTTSNKPFDFFVTEAKTQTTSLMEHLSQVIGEIYACSIRLKKDTLRGAITNGAEWVFIVVTQSPATKDKEKPLEKAKYKYSEVISKSNNGDLWHDIVSGILFHWIKNSYNDIGSDDWFAVAAEAEADDTMDL